MSKSISFKASNEYFLLIISPEASILNIYEELRVLMNHLNQEPEVPNQYEINIKTGRRLLTDEEKNTIYSIVEAGSKWRVKSIESDVISVQDAIQWNKEVNTRVEFRNILSGEILETKGDILLVGDVAPGGFIRATGNIFILGNLEGIADAGIDGNGQAVIVGAFKRNSEIRINKVNYSIKHSINNKNVSLPIVYYLDHHGSVERADVNQIAEIRPEIDQVLNSFT